MSEILNELENKIIAELEKQLAVTIKQRDAIQGERGQKPPEFWTYQADFIRLSQEIGRRKRRMGRV